MKFAKSALAKSFLLEARKSIAAYHLPRVVQCLKALPEDDIWWRPNGASNSAGNLVLHVSGNVRQWIIAGLGDEEDTRDRDREFSERGPMARRALVSLISGTVKEASRVLNRMTEDSLLRIYRIQGFRVSGTYAVFQVVHHFAYHTGQIIFITKSKLGRDLNFTRLPAYKPKRAVNPVP